MSWEQKSAHNSTQVIAKIENIVTFYLIYEQVKNSMLL
jgi:nitrate reductase NapAB chaperone NapD